MQVPLNLLDGWLLLVLGLAGVAGWRRGFARGCAGLLSLAAAVALAFGGSAALASGLRLLWPGLALWAHPLALAVLWLAAQLVFTRSGRHLLRQLPARVHGAVPNRILGLLPGLAFGVLQAVVIVLLLYAVPLPAPAEAWLRGSRIVRGLEPLASQMQAHVGAIFEPALRQAWGRAQAQATAATLAMPGFRASDARVRPDLEAQMLELVNQDRVRAGLPALSADPDIASVARAHSLDMLTRGYFSHVSPEGRTLADRLRQGRVRYLVAGENLAWAHSLERAHQGLMASPGHRANLLRPRYGRVGIGVLDAGPQGLMVTQNFRN